MDIKEHLTSLSSKLAEVSEVSQLEAEILVSFCVNKPKEFLFSHPEYELDDKEIKKLKSLLARRLKHEPIAYITGTKEFFGHQISVNSHVLIPRPESEQLVELAIKEIRTFQQTKRDKKSTISVHELATGSGAVIISIAREMENSDDKVSCSASDISKKSLSVAKSNAKRILKKSQIKLRKLDILKTKNFSSVDILIANPPYIPTSKIKTLKPEIKNFEPKKALDGGESGLKFYQAIFRSFAKKSSKVLILELESENAEKIFQLAEKIIPAAEKKLYKDLSGKNRVLLLKFT